MAEYREAWAAIDAAYCMDEITCIRQLLALINLPHREIRDISSDSRRLISEIRHQRTTDTVHELLQEYQLSTDEGLALMCLAEALLRIPDSTVAQQLIRDRISGGDWQAHLRQEHSLLINASTALLMLSGKVLRKKTSEHYIRKLIRRVGKPVVHQSMLKVVRSIAGQFVFAEDITQAMEKIGQNQQSQTCYSLDMLGEAAITASDAEKYFESYLSAIEALSTKGIKDANISIKLSALYPRFEIRHQDKSVEVLLDKMRRLVTAAKVGDVSITIDAEEAERLKLTLQVFTALCRSDVCEGYTGMGLAVQAYSKRALPVLRYLHKLSVEQQRKIPVRLVKGAYWDSEIKQAQVNGQCSYPVFTEKNHTDVSYLACVHFMHQHQASFYPQFATHNISTIAHILHLYRGVNEFEFQRLHGMGEEIYKTVLSHYPQAACRVYGPVGIHKDLLAYLVRRILENGANNSFLKQLMEGQTVDARLAIHPVDLLENLDGWQPSIPLPSEMYLPQRANAATCDLVDDGQRLALQQRICEAQQHILQAQPLVDTNIKPGAAKPVLNPFNQQLVGQCMQADADTALKAMYSASVAYSTWHLRPASQRIEPVLRFASALEERFDEYVSLLVLEAGKTQVDAINEVRETLDFAYYYSAEAERLFSEPMDMPGPVGESNHLHWRGRGVFLCISPWNFPLAIFTGQVLAALLSGNTVLAKPAEATPLIAFRICQLLHEAGIPSDVLQLLPGRGELIGKALCADQRLAGVAFTGSTRTAQTINRYLAERQGPIIPLIAETGGQNVMIADSSTLPEQLVKDIIHSAFYSAGQRCSALRVLYLQQEIFTPVMALLKGAMQQLCIGDPAELQTDIGPVIDDQAYSSLLSHTQYLQKNAHLIYQCEVSTNRHHLFPPCVYQIESIRQLDDEYFGPILHVIPFAYEDIDKCVNEINETGYGLTLGIHSRNERWALQLAERIHVGNIYINREMTGAVVGVQPFGGQGLSGTGPKAGGPNYLQRFATEVTITNNIAAMGGNASLLTGRGK